MSGLLTQSPLSPQAQLGLTMPREYCIPDIVTKIPFNPNFITPSLNLPGNLDTHLALLRLLARKGLPACPPDISADDKRDQRLELFSTAIQQAITTGTQVGSFVDLCKSGQPRKVYVIGDLHGRLDNLATLLANKTLWAEVRSGAAALVFVGDYVHSEHPSLLANMDSSYRLMQWVMELKIACPQHVHLLLGNHDFLRNGLSKNKIKQGELFEVYLQTAIENSLFTKFMNQESYIDKYQKIMCSLPLIARAPGFVIAHAGPPVRYNSKYTLDDLKNIPVTDSADDSNQNSLQIDLTWGCSFDRPGNPCRQFELADVQMLLKVCEQEGGVMLTGHQIGIIKHGDGARNICDYNAAVWATTPQSYVVHSGLNNVACFELERKGLTAVFLPKLRGFHDVDPDDFI